MPSNQLQALLEDLKRIARLATFVEAPVHPYHPLDGLMVFQADTAKYQLAGDRLIGLNLAKTGLTEAQWQEICELDAFQPADLLALNLSDNVLAELHLPDQMQQLCRLNLSDNEALTTLRLPTHLPAMTRLDLRGCALSTLQLPADMPQLEQLDLSYNQLTEIRGLDSSRTVRHLILSHNQLQAFSLSRTMPDLRLIHLRHNQLQHLDLSGALPSLQTLDLRQNKLEDIPSLHTQLPSLENLYLYNNPLSNIPDGIIPTEEHDNAFEDLSNYQREHAKGTDHNTRIKLIIVGNGRVGKTSLFRRLKGESIRKEPVTHGVEIGELTKAHLAGVTKVDDLHVQVWDFGGQEIFHATHQFFLNDSALYLMVWTEKANVLDLLQETEAKYGVESWRTREYWLDNIRLHAQESPIIMVQTHIDKQETTIPQTEYQTLYQAVCHNVSSAKGWGLDRLTSLIEQTLNEEISFLGEEVAATYLQAVEAITELRASQPTLSWTGFEELCRSIRLEVGSEASLCRYLHKVGVLVSFRGDRRFPLLQDILYIDPNWLTEQVYRLIDPKLREQVRPGHISQDYLTAALPEYSKAQQEQFLELLTGFGLIFKEFDTPDSYISPQYLPAQLTANEQVLFDSLDEDLELAFLFRFPRFLPDNVMINFLSRYGPYSRRLYWKKGIFFKAAFKTPCTVTFDATHRCLTVRTHTGPTALALQAEICQAFVELSRTQNAELSIDGRSFISWQDLQADHAKKAQEVSCTDIETGQSFNQPIEGFRHFLTPHQPDSTEDTHLDPHKPHNPASPMDSIKQLIARGRLQAAYDRLAQHIPPDHPSYDSLILLSGQLASWTDDQISGTQPSSALNTRRNQLAKQLLLLINRVESDINPTLKAPPTDISVGQSRTPQSSTTENEPTPNPPTPTGDSSILRGFVSYAHADDKRYMQLFMTGIKDQADGWDLFDDRQVLLGTDWNQRLQQEINRCDFGIMLLTPHFFKSSYIREQEFKRLVQRDASGGCPIFSVPLMMYRNKTLSQWKELTKRQYFVAEGQDYGMGDTHRQQQVYFEELCRVSDNGYPQMTSHARRFCLNFVEQVEESLAASS